MMLTQQLFLCLDPGQNKIGICILNYEGLALELKVIPVKSFEKYLQEKILEYSFNKIILGNGTAFKKVFEILTKNLSINKEKIILVEEKFSSEQARKLYFQKNPPQGLKKFVPLTMQIPPGNIDSYAAWILGKQWLKNTNGK